MKKNLIKLLDDYFGEGREESEKEVIAEFIENYAEDIEEIFAEQKVEDEKLFAVKENRFNHIETLEEAKKLVSEERPIVVGYWVTKEQYLFSVVEKAYGKNVHFDMNESTKGAIL